MNAKILLLSLAEVLVPFLHFSILAGVLTRFFQIPDIPNSLRSRDYGLGRVT